MNAGAAAGLIVRLDPLSPSGFNLRPGRRLLQFVASVQGDDTAGEILELPENRQLKLFLEQFRVGSESIEHQHEHVAADFVDQQPVRFDVAFPGSRESAGKAVVAVFFG